MRKKLYFEPSNYIKQNENTLETEKTTRYERRDSQVHQNISLVAKKSSEFSKDPTHLHDDLLRIIAL